MVMTSSAGGGDEEGVKAYFTERPEITCREAKTMIIDGYTKQRKESGKVTDRPAVYILNTLCF